MFKNLFSGFRPKFESISKIGSTSDIEVYLPRLMHPSGHGFLAIKFNEQEDFIQLSGSPEGIQIDFPLITPRQKELENTIRAACNSLSLQLTDSKGSDGARFLDINLDGEANQLAIIVQKFLSQAFSVSSTSKLFFDGQLIAA